MTAVPHPGRKILTRQSLIDRFGRPRANRVAFTNGCFDLVHRGHVEYLFAARDHADALVVGLNTDDSVRRLKGAGRPLVPEDDRAFVIAGLACVDAVTLFDEDTPRELIRALLPDLLVKGGDYTPHTVVGRDDVEAAGGRVLIVPLVAGRSTTEIVRRAGGQP